MNKLFKLLTLVLSIVFFGCAAQLSRWGDPLEYKAAREERVAKRKAGTESYRNTEAYFITSTESYRYNTGGHVEKDQTLRAPGMYYHGVIINETRYPISLSMLSEVSSATYSVPPAKEIPEGILDAIGKRLVVPFIRPAELRSGKYRISMKRAGSQSSRRGKELYINRISGDFTLEQYWWTNPESKKYEYVDWIIHEDEYLKRSVLSRPPRHFDFFVRCER